MDNIRQTSEVPQSRFRADALAAALYLKGGVRAAVPGALAFAGKSPSGEEVYPRLELLRLAIPRRAYAYTHLQYVAEVFGQLAERKGGSAACAW